jgi:hypothetical protein
MLKYFHINGLNVVFFNPILWFLFGKGDLEVLKLAVVILISLSFTAFIFCLTLLYHPHFSYSFTKELEITKKKPQNVTQVRNKRRRGSGRDMKTKFLQAALSGLLISSKLQQRSVPWLCVLCFVQIKVKNKSGDKSVFI